MAAALLIGAAAFAWPGTAASEDVEHIPVANAQSTVGAIAPSAGSIRLTVAFGNAAADLSGSRTRGRANDVELGLLGSIITGETCGRTFFPPSALPHPVMAASPDGPPTAKQTRIAVPQGPNSNANVASVNAEASPDRATGASEGARIAVPGLVTVSGGRSHASTTLKNGVREAVATADFASIAVGPVKLEDIHTESFNRSGTKNEHGTIFKVGAIIIGGVRTEPPADASPSAILDPLNTVLAPLGIQFVAPKAEYIGQTQYLRPLEIVVGKSLVSETAVGPLVGALQPARTQLDQLAADVCGAPAVLTVADVGLALAAGSGTLALQFGGVETTSGEITAKNPFGTFVPPKVTTPSVSALPEFVTPAVPGTPPQVRRIAGDQLVRSDALEARAGRAALAGLLGLLVIAVLAGRDWLVMRTNSRSLLGGSDD